MQSYTEFYETVNERQHGRAKFIYSCYLCACGLVHLMDKKNKSEQKLQWHTVTQSIASK